MNIRYEPIKEIVVHEVNKLGIKDLVIARTGSNTPPRLLWCDGVAFFVISTADAKTYDENLEKGKLVFNRVFFAELREHVPILSVDTDEFGGIKANIDDVSWSEMYGQLVSWIKSQSK